jgi:hypothetical protein
VGSLATWEHHLRQSYHPAQPIEETSMYNQYSTYIKAAKYQGHPSGLNLPQSLHSHETTSWRQTPRRYHTRRHS